MPFTNTSNLDQIISSSNQIPDEISPKVYLQPYVDWLNTKAENVLRHVRLRIVWLHAPGSNEESIISYGEIGFEGHADLEKTMKLGVTQDMKIFLKGFATLYSSKDRWGNAPSGGLSGLPFPFDPNKKSLVGITIWTQTGQVDLDFSSRQPNWTIMTKYEAVANQLWGFPTGEDTPSVKPLILLSLSTHQVFM